MKEREKTQLNLKELGLKKQNMQNFDQAKRAPRAAFPSGCLAAQTKRWAEGIRVPEPLAGGGSTTAISLCFFQPSVSHDVLCIEVK